MDENNEAPKSKVRLFLENFFYHYKWHTIIALFLVFVIVICSLQMCNKTTYDVYILYAGRERLPRTSQDGNVPPFSTALSALKRFAEDYDGNGETNVSFEALYLLSDKELAALEEELAEARKEYPDASINYTLLSDNRKSFRDDMMVGDYYVCLLSPHLVEEYAEFFTPIAPYAPEGLSPDAYYNEAAIRLSALPLADKAGFDLLPEETVLALRKFSEVSAHFNAARNREMYARSETYLRALLAAK